MFAIIILAGPAAALAEAPAGKTKSRPRVEYGVVMLETPLAQWQEIQDHVAEADLDTYREKNREDWPHITLLHGLTEASTAEVEAILKKFGRPLTYQIVDVSRFEGKWTDVLKFGIQSTDAVEINRLLKTLPCKNEYDGYSPHMTIGFLKKTVGARYDYQFEPPASYQSARILYVTAGGEKHWIELAPAAAVKADAPLSGARPAGRWLSAPASAPSAPAKPAGID